MRDAIDPDAYPGTVALDDLPVTLPTGVMPRVTTLMTHDEIRAALIAGHVIVTGKAPSYNRLAVAWAQQCFEGDHGRAVHCNNFGNVDATEDWHGPVFPLTAGEVIDDVEVNRTKLLRWYPSAEEGAAGYWRFLMEHARFTPALALFDAGDGYGAVMKLKNPGGYFTGNAGAYAKAVAWLVGLFKRTYPGV